MKYQENFLRFTFHYVSIKTEKVKKTHENNKHLHSTMYLLKPQPPNIVAVVLP